MQPLRRFRGTPADDRGPNAARTGNSLFSALRLSMPMRLFSRRFPSVAHLLLATGLLLDGCASPTPPTPPAAAVEPRPLPPSGFPDGIWVDCSYGFGRHQFGDLLRHFPKMRPLPPAPGEGTRGFLYPGATTWFGSKGAPVRGPYCYFFDRRFYRFQIVAEAAVLRPAALEMFGPGQAQGPHRLVWEGYRARAVYSETPTPRGYKGQLDVVSKPLEAALAAKQHARLKAESAHQGAGK